MFFVAPRAPRGTISGMQTLGALYGSTVAVLLAGTGVLHLVPCLGAAGRRCAEALCRAPGVDLALGFFTIAPVVVGAVLAGWSGVGIALAAEVTALLVWIALHELVHPQARRGPRIQRYVSRLVGRWRNHTAIWITALVVPIFWLVRFAEILLYPPLVWLLGFPRYRHADWVNVSRHKFSALVGYDLIWCLYCDWMTGVWSLGTEMLRNVESFWCPIRFSSDKKCENCQVDFPDIDGGWISADGTMVEVVELIERQYADGNRGWFAHPGRRTDEPVPARPRQDDQPRRAQAVGNPPGS